MKYILDILYVLFYILFYKLYTFMRFYLLPREFSIMSVLEKQAWFIVIVFGITTGHFGGSILIFGWHEALLGTIGFYGLAGGAGLIGRREKKAGKMVMDERDAAIERAANLIGYSVFWIVFVLVVMAPFFIYGPDHIIMIKAGPFTMTIVFAMMIVYTARSLAIIVQYRRTNHG